jgi:hypothetical protein
LVIDGVQTNPGQQFEQVKIKFLKYCMLEIRRRRQGDKTVVRST